MLDGVVDIPLPGRPLDLAGLADEPPKPCHFVAGPENRLVPVAVHSVLAERGRSRAALPDSAHSTTAYNPLYLHGPSGAGKSHLARGLADAWHARNRRRRIVCTTAVDFARELADAIDSQSVEEFRTKHRTAELLVFEDLGQLATRKTCRLSAQEEFLHTLDALVARGGWVVVTASAAPPDLPEIIPALQSRLAAGLTLPLAPPGPETRLAVLRQLADLHQIDLPDDAVRILAEELEGTVPELAGVLVQLALTARLDSEPIDAAAIRRCLEERDQKPRPTLHQIALATARHFTLRLADLRSPVRRRALVTARGVAVYLARHDAGENFEEIGRYFGGRDHTTIMHSLRRTEDALVSDPAVGQAIERLRKTLWRT